MNKKQTERESGAVSIFLVIFFALLLGVITVSFIGIVMRNTVQAYNADLSRSAYDSAEAGIEDAKRAIAKTVSACNSGGPCSQYKGYLNGGSCTQFLGFASVLGLDSDGSQVKVHTGTDTSFDQSYTCVSVKLNTPDYISNESDQSSDIIPIDAADSAGNTSQPTLVRLSWFTHRDMNSTNDADQFDPRTSSIDQLPPESSWGSNATPPILRLELVSYRDGAITDTDLDRNMRTIFLYPKLGNVADATFAVRDPEHDAPAAGPTIVAAACNRTGEYACALTVRFDNDTNAIANRKTFLRVTPIYKATTFRVELDNGQYFNGVQPLVDSTGRAGDLYRRIQARVRMQNNVLYPEFAVDSQNAFCKNFSIGSSTDDFRNSCSD